MYFENSSMFAFLISALIVVAVLLAVIIPACYFVWENCKQRRNQRNTDPELATSNGILLTAKVNGHANGAVPSAALTNGHATPVPPSNDDDESGRARLKITKPSTLSYSIKCSTCSLIKPIQIENSKVKWQDHLKSWSLPFYPR